MNEPAQDGAPGSRYPDRIQLEPIVTLDDAVAYLTWCKDVMWPGRLHRSAEILVVIDQARAALAAAEAERDDARRSHEFTQETLRLAMQRYERAETERDAYRHTAERHLDRLRELEEIDKEHFDCPTHIKVLLETRENVARQLAAERAASQRLACANRILEQAVNWSAVEMADVHERSAAAHWRDRLTDARRRAQEALKTAAPTAGASDGAALLSRYRAALEAIIERRDGCSVLPLGLADAARIAEEALSAAPPPPPPGATDEAAHPFTLTYDNDMNRLCVQPSPYGGTAYCYLPEEKHAPATDDGARGGDGVL